MEIVLDIERHTLSAPAQSHRDRGFESRREDIQLECPGGIARSPNINGRYAYQESKEWAICQSGAAYWQSAMEKLGLTQGMHVRRNLEL